MKGGQIGIVENNSHNQMLWTESVSGPHPQPQPIGWNCNLHMMVFGDEEFGTLGLWRCKWGLWDRWGLGDDEVMRL